MVSQSPPEGWPGAEETPMIPADERRPKVPGGAPMRPPRLHPRRAALAAGLLLVAALPVQAGVHYKATTRTHDSAGKSSEVQVEGWAAGDKARIEFSDVVGSGAPFARKGGY